MAATASAQNRKRHMKHTFTTDTVMAHDPVMAVENGIFHLFSTGRGLQHATSADRKLWTVHAGPAMDSIPQWAHDSVPGFKDHVWAPDIIRYRDKWWLAYSCSTFGKNTSAIGLASADSLSDDIRWHDEGAIICSREGRDNWNAIDPNFITDGDGNPWLTFGSFWDGIQLARLDSTMRIADRSSLRTIARHKTGGRANPVEAPFIFRHGGYYYLFVSWDYCCRGTESTYKVVVGRSRNVDGPYLDRNGHDMLHGGGTLVIEGDKRQFEAAGHCAVYRFGGDDILICHGYSIARDGAPVLIQRRIAWTSDGWPEIKQ